MVFVGVFETALLICLSYTEHEITQKNSMQLGIQKSATADARLGVAARHQQGDDYEYEQPINQIQERLPGSSIRGTR